MASGENTGFRLLADPDCHCAAPARWSPIFFGIYLNYLAVLCSVYIDNYPIQLSRHPQRTWESPAGGTSLPLGPPARIGLDGRRAAIKRACVATVGLFSTARSIGRCTASAWRLAIRKGGGHTRALLSRSSGATRHGVKSTVARRNSRQMRLACNLRDRWLSVKSLQRRAPCGWRWFATAKRATMQSADPFGSDHFLRNAVSRLRLGNQEEVTGQCKSTISGVCNLECETLVPAPSPPAPLLASSPVPPSHTLQPSRGLRPLDAVTISYLALAKNYSPG
jgi:hypothetical protein